jgi:hypothetical protein
MRNQRGGNLIERVRHQTEQRALEQARRVTWPRLAAAAGEHTEWQVFGLWLRAVVDAAGGVPDMITLEMESRTPKLLGRIRPDIEAAVKTGSRLGARIWQDVSIWAEMNVFIAAKRAGWLGAVRYFSSMSLRSMQAWSHWENVDKEWRAAAPMQFPSYAQWRCDVTALAKLSNPDSEAQQVLDSVLSVSEAEWNRLLHGFSILITFSLWMELVLDIEGPTSCLVSKELAEMYPGFRFSNGSKEPKEVARSLHRWVIEHSLAIADQEQMLAALSFHVRHHPAYPATRRYALRCHEIWRIQCPDHMPSFEDWRQAADAYVENCQNLGARREHRHQVPCKPSKSVS